MKSGNSPTVIKKVLIVVVALVGAYYASQQSSKIVESSPASLPANAQLYRAIDERRNGYQVQGGGRVARVLVDDNNGSRHQRFILELDSGQTLLVAHNIDVAPRVFGLKPGDRVSFFGEYEWNEHGGVIHWTHHDPQGRHVDGWVEYNGKRYK
jgi:hypothetical protein